MSLAKKDLSQKLKQELNLTLETTDLLVDEFFSTIKKSLRDSKVVKFSGFGTFKSFRQKQGQAEILRPWRLFLFCLAIKLDLQQQQKQKAS